MTVDEGRKPDGAPERSAKAGEGAPSGVDANGPKRFSVQRKMAVVSTVARRAAGSCGPGHECLGGQADRMARTCSGRRRFSSRQ